MGSDQADEGDRASDRYGGSRKRHAQHQQEEALAADPAAGSRRHVVAELEDVDLPRINEGQRDERRRPGQDEQDDAPIGAVHRACNPDECLGRGIHGTFEQDDLGRRAEQKVDSDPDEHETDRRHALLPGEKINEQGRAACSEHSRKRQPDDADGAAEDADEKDSRQRRPARNADDVGRGERIADDALQDRARDSQRRPDEKGCRDAGQPELLDDQPMLLRAESEQRPDHLQRMQAHVAESGGKQHRGDAGDGEPDRQGQCFRVEEKRDREPFEANGLERLHRSIPPFLAMAMKAGMPIMAVMTPTGSSSGWMMKRPATSAATTRIAPSTAL